jgi:hypothetical protein
VAVLQSVVQLPVPGVDFAVRPGEFKVLRSVWTGVRAFGALLRHTPLRHLGGRVYLSTAGRDPGAILRGLHTAEGVHLWALLCCCPWLMYWGLRGSWMPLLLGLCVHVPLNIYPILHLRYVNWRIDACLAKRQRREPFRNR